MKKEETWKGVLGKDEMGRKKAGKGSKTHDREVTGGDGCDYGWCRGHYWSAPVSSLSILSLRIGCFGQTAFLDQQ